MSCQIAMAFRPWLSPSSIVSRYGSQALAEGFGWGRCRGGFSVKDLLKSVVTPASLAGFESAESVITPLAGFDDRRPHPPGGRTAIPDAFRYAPAVSRRTPVACSMRRSVQPSFPSAITCCFFSSFKTLLMPTERIRRSQCPERWFIVGRFSADNHWPVLGDRRGRKRDVFWLWPVLLWRGNVRQIWPSLVYIPT